MKSIFYIITPVLLVFLLLACKDDNSKPIAKADQYPSALYGTWEWPCIKDYDTQDTAAPLYRQQKRFYGPNNTYLFERTTYAFKSQITNKCTVPLAKATHKGTYNARVKEDLNVSSDIYVEVDYEITEIIFEGNTPLAATTASRNRHVVGFQFFDIVSASANSSQMSIGWNVEMEEDAAKRPTSFNVVLNKSEILQPDFQTTLANRTYNVSTLDDIAGLWEQNCTYRGIDVNSKIVYYRLHSYNITSIDGVNGTYVETDALYTGSKCTGSPVAFYTYPATITIDSAIGNGTGVAVVDLVNVVGLHTIITNGDPYLTPSLVSAEISSWLGNDNSPITVLEIMISDPLSNYLFVDGRKKKWLNGQYVPYTREENAINDVYVRKTLVEPLTNL